MIKKHEFNYLGMSKDYSNDLQGEKYFDARNIRTTALDKKSQMAVTNELGNELIFAIPTPVLNYVGTAIEYTVGAQTKSLSYEAIEAAHPRCEIESQFMTDATTVKVSGDQVIVGVKELRDSAIVVTTDNNGFDCIWELTGINQASFGLDLLYMADLGLSTDNLLQILYNYENSIVQKMYFVDGVHQIRYVNIRQSVANGDNKNLIDISPSLLDIVSTYTLQQPEIVSVTGGGSHTAGKIQYAYGLFILNGAQTTGSPLSHLVPIDKGEGLGGGDVNENLGKSVIVKVTDIDPKFTHIKIYAIKYTSYNENPQVVVVAEREIDNFTEFTYTDDGNYVEEISLEAFQFLGSSPIVPEHIVAKDNRLFPVNIKESVFDVELDTRAYAFGASTETSHVSTFSFRGDATANGNMILQVEDVVYYVPVLDGDSKDTIAEKVRVYLDANLVGYDPVQTTSGLFNSKVIITRTAAGPVSDSVAIGSQVGVTISWSNSPGSLANNTCVVMNNAFYDDDTNTVVGEESSVTSPDFVLGEKHDAINRDYDVYKYQADGTTLGASGKYLDITLSQRQYAASEAVEASKLEILKDNEMYRLGIKFYNQRGQSSNPKWVMDFRSPEGNLNRLHAQIGVTMTADFYVWLNDSSNFESEDDKPVGYKLLRADRTLNDQTIFAQGIVNPMVANYVHQEKFVDIGDRIQAVTSTSSDVLPSAIRKFKTDRPFVKCKNFHETAWSYEDGDIATTNTGPYGPAILSPLSKLRPQFNSGGFNTKETYSGPGGDYRAQTFQFTTMMQFFSPEILFRNVAIDAGYKLKVVGLIKESSSYNWSTESHPLTSEIAVQAKYVGGFTRGPGVGATETISNESYLNDFGFYGPTNDKDNIATQQCYREFLGAVSLPTANKDRTIHDVFGTPELTDEGADFKRYNGNPALKYANHIKNMLQDKFAGDADDGRDVQIKGVNSNGARCLTFALGPDDTSFDISQRPTLESIYADADIDEDDGILLTEFVRDDYISYVGGIYGGFAYESKRNSEYIEIGEFTNITDSALVTSPGDTFVDTFTFTKFAKDDLQNTTQTQNLMCEIVSFRCETSVDLKNRKDLSSGTWDARFQPKHEEYTNYNLVYSQQPILTKTSDVGAKFKKVQEFDTRIISTKVKTPGEFIDSWTDMLENETMDLDGTYGPINAVVTLKDEIFCLQDTAVSMIAINPRVQIAPGDGVALELGTGGILHDYKYLSTTIGCLNKFGVISTENTFYFVDVINRGIMSFSQGQVARFSDLKGFHHTLVNDMSYDKLLLDNPVKGDGISIGYNPASADVYFSFRQSPSVSTAKDAVGDFTLGFNEKTGEFVCYYDYIPAWYINKGSTLISSSPDSDQVWEHGVGTPNNFYGVQYPSSITLHVAPPGHEVILNSASYKLEATDSAGRDLPTTGLTHVEVYNDYQTSGKVALQIRKNAFKKFRNWKINLPREQGMRERMRSAWGFVKFTFDNPEGNNLILHNISIFYTEH